MNADDKTKIISSYLSKCPKCDYKDGFHIAFKAGENEKTELIFICPSCHSRFGTGWFIDVNN